MSNIGCPKKRTRNVWLTTEQKFFVQLSNSFISIGNTLTKILRPILLKSDVIWLRYINFKTDKLISTFRILSIFRVSVSTTCLNWVICHYEEIFAEYKLKWSYMFYLRKNKILDRIIHQGMNVHLYFDICNIGQPSIKGALSLIAPERSSGTVI